MDPTNPHWGWNWLDRWMDSRPWEGQNTKDENNHKSAKGAASHTMSVGEISKLYALRDQNQNQDNKTSPTSQKPIPQNLASRNIPSTPIKGRAKTSSTGSWGGDGDSKSMFNKTSESKRRHSISVSPEKADESLVNTPARVTVAKNKVQSTSAKKQLSSLASGSGTRRHSVPSKMGMNSNKNGVATIPEGKVRNGGNR